MYIRDGLDYYKDRRGSPANTQHSVFRRVSLNLDMQTLGDASKSQSRARLVSLYFTHPGLPGPTLSMILARSSVQSDHEVQPIPTTISVLPVAAVMCRSTNDAIQSAPYRTSRSGTSVDPHWWDLFTFSTGYRVPDVLFIVSPSRTFAFGAVSTH